MARFAGARPGDQEEVPARTDPLQSRPDQLSQPTTHPIALNGAAQRPWRRQPDARLVPIGPQPAEDQQRGRARGALTADGLEVRAAPESRQHRHGVAARLGGSGGQPLAPLGSTTSEHAPSTLRSHAGHEAMLALARALLGLIRPLRHACVPFLVQRSRFRPFTHEGLAFCQPARTNSLARLAWWRILPAAWGRVKPPSWATRRIRILRVAVSAGTWPAHAATACATAAGRPRNTPPAPCRGPMVPIHCPAERAAAIVARPRLRTSSSASFRPGGGLIFQPSGGAADRPEKLD